MERSQVLEVVRTTTAEVLAVDDDEVRLEHSLQDDLGAESIDLLDLLFRLQRSLDVKMKREDIGAMLRGDLSGEDFASPSGRVTDAGVAQLKKVLPQIDAEALRGKLDAADIFPLMTVENLGDMVLQRMQP